MAFFFLLAPRPALAGKSSYGGRRARKRAIFVARIDYLYLKRSTEYVIPHTIIVTQNNSPQHVGQARGREQC